MKKIFLFICLFCFAISYAQSPQSDLSTDNPKNEITINALYLVLGSFDVTYERLLNEYSGVGVTASVTFDPDFWDLNYAFTGFYRHYFGKRYAQGFFTDAFAMLNNTTVEYFQPWGFWNEWSSYSRTYTDLALGFGVGGKWVSKRGVLLETRLALGRQLFNASKTGDDIVGRFGVTVGYRF